MSHTCKPIIAAIRHSQGWVYYLGCPEHVLVIEGGDCKGHRICARVSPFDTREEIIKLFFQKRAPWLCNEGLPQR